MTNPMQRRVVITGLGVVASNGFGKADFWQAFISGRSGFRRITSFDASSLPTRIAGEIPTFDPEALGLTPEESSTLDRGTQFAVAAANLALHDSNLRSSWSEAERDFTGVYMGIAMASVEEGARLWMQFTSPRAHPPRAIIHDTFPATLFLSYAPASAIAAHHQLHGPGSVISTGCYASAR